MQTTRILSFLASAILATATFAAQPTNPGPPASGGPPAPPLPHVIDSTGKVVGDIVAGGLATATVRYVLADGNAVLLQASSEGLSGGRVRAGLRPDRPETFDAFFTTTDCTGDAWVPAYRPGTALTKQQAVTIPYLFGETPVQSCQLFAPGNFLFVSDPLACLYNAGTNPPLTFVAYYGFDPDSGMLGCVPLPDDGLTVPDEFDSGPYRIYHRVEDLDAKFTPPYYVP